MKKKILMIIPKLVDGGAERVVSNLTQELDKKYDIDILLDYNATGYPYRGNIICVVEKDSEPNGVKKLGLYIKKYRILRRMKRKGQYEGYISHSRISNILNVLSGYKKYNVMVTLHCSVTKPAIDSVKERILVWLEKYAFRHAPKVISVCQGVALELTELWGVKEENITSIWNGSDIEAIQQLTGAELNQKQCEWMSDSLHVVTAMGRYTFEKGHWHLIRSFTRVVQKYPDARLLLLGDGKLREYYETLISKLNLQDHVILCGFQENPFAVIGRSNLFVFPSLSEGFPCSLVEAICCKVPVVGADFKNGAREIFNYGLDRNAIQNQFECLEYGIMAPICSGEMHTAEIKLEKQEKILADSILYMFEHEEYAQNTVKRNMERLQEFSISEMARRWDCAIGAEHE